MPARRRQADLNVLACDELGADLVLLQLDLSQERAGPDEFQAGQFAQLAIPGRALPRPFSILRADDGRIEFLVKRVGPGTNWLAQLRPGDRVTTTWPLGRGFTCGLQPEQVQGDWLLVGGGVGIAPLIALWERETRPGQARLLFGHRDQASAEAAAQLHPGIQPLLSTEDGTQGLHGRVTELLVRELALDPKRRPSIFCCGPEAMMEAVAIVARDRGLPCRLSLETLMGCGIGICVGCAVPRGSGGYFLACQEGPVFEAADLALHSCRSPEPAGGSPG